MFTATRRGFVLAWLGLGLGSCLSPTLPPLPPPHAPTEMSYLSSGQLLLSGQLPQERGLVFVLNLANDEIAGEQVRARRYSVVIAAQPGDPIELWYTLGTDQSDVSRFRAPPYPANFTQLDAGSSTGGQDAAVGDASAGDPEAARPNDAAVDADTAP